MVWESHREIQRDQVTFPVGASVQEGLFVGWAQSDQVKCLSQRREALALGRVRERQVHPGEQLEGFGRIRGVGRRGEVQRKLPSDGLGESGSCVTNFGKSGRSV